MTVKITYTDNFNQCASEKKTIKKIDIEDVKDISSAEEIQKILRLLLV